MRRLRAAAPQQIFSIALDNARNVTNIRCVVGFGELRRLSAQWGVDIAAVERAYAMDWLLKGIFDHAPLARTFVLRGATALCCAYCADYPPVEGAEFFALETPHPAALRAALDVAANVGGVRFLLPDASHVEYTGPLGRRSAAQPRIALTIVRGKTRIEPVRVPLIHRFSDDCHAIVAACALEELVAERAVALAQSLRARDVFDLWFALTRAQKIDAARAKMLAAEIAREKNVALPRADALWDRAQRAALERAWDNALRRVGNRPSFSLVEKDLADALGNLLDA
jgi:predicted nucleotidyltransferase component of viral defense system